MSYPKNNVWELLSKISEHCKGEICEDCELYNEEWDRCMLGDTPDNWDIEEFPVNLFDD